MADEENAAPTVWSGAKEMFTGSYLNVLLVAIPFALLSEWTGWSDSATFAFSLLAIAPLAERLGFVTEQLALHTNDSIGALLNVTFGNATELIVAISALTKGLFRVVQLTLLGSVLSNMLLVLGCAFLFGGLKYSTQYFNKITSQANMTLLMLSVMGLLFPTVLTLSDTESLGGQLGLSRCCAIILFLMYCLFIYFQLVTHRHVFEERPQSEIDAISRTASLSSASSTASVNPIHERMSAQAQAELAKDDSESGSDVEAGTDGVAMLAKKTSSKRFDMYSPITNDDEEKGDPNKIKFKVSSPNSKLNVTSPNAKLNTSVLTDIEISSAPEVDEPQNDDPDEEDEDDDDDDEEEDLLGFWPALTWLAVITILISILSDYLVKSIEKAAAAWNISGIFLSAIVIPIIGNAAEHAGAVIFAMKNKLDLALGIAIGSSTQIALMVLPMLVIIGWMDRKSMTMNFQSYEATTLFLTVVTVTFAIKDGNSNWLIGAALLAAYVMISAGFWVHHDESLT